MNVAIVGSRDFNDLDRVRAYVQTLPHNVTIITGGAPGVDQCAEQAAKARGLVTLVFPAQWQRYGRKAGPLRNQLIVDAADRLVAFWDGQSRGTQNSIDLARKKGIPVEVIQA